MMPDPEAVVVSVTWRKATAGERPEAGLVMVSYADGAIQSRPSTRMAARMLAAHYFGSDSRQFEDEMGIRWRLEPPPPMTGSTADDKE